MSDTLTFVHLTDLHVGNPAVTDERLYSDTSRTLATILSEVKALVPTPAFVVASGDLTNRGDVGSYAELQRLFAEAALDIPVLFALGNHDTRPGFRAAVLAETSNLDAPYFHATVIGGIHIIVLDTSAPFKVGGAISPEQFDWLGTELGQHADLPKLIVAHHPPALDEDNASLEWESINIPDTIRLRTVLAGHRVLGLLCGHIHYDRVSLWHGIPVVVGMGQHMGTDVRYLHEGLRMVTGGSFALGTVRASGLTISFVPQPSERREIKSYTYAAMAEVLKHYEGDAAARAAAE